LTFLPSEIRLLPIDARRNCFFPAKAAEPETGTTFDFLNADAWGHQAVLAIGVHVCLAHRYSHSQRLVQTT
jgi:hypothetical protein